MPPRSPRPPPPCSTAGSPALSWPPPPGAPIMGTPRYEGTCSGCSKCVLICPGLAITMVDFRKDKENPFVTVPYEVFNYRVNKDDPVEAVDIEGRPLGKFTAVSVVAT